MSILLKKYYFYLQVKFLIIFKATLLFEKINQFDWYKHTLRQWIDEQNLANNSEILEIGCATGTLTTYIAQSGCIPTGVDFSSKMIQLAKINHPDIDFSVANIFDLPFKSASFNAVIARSFVNLFTNDEAISLRYATN
jgi:ubiquinone/menaquinone biosynthesis C-methylase UbiE